MFQMVCHEYHSNTIFDQTATSGSIIYKNFTSNLDRVNSYPFNYKNYRTGLLLSLLSAVIIFLISLLIGKDRFFLALNGDMGLVGDYFFRFYTFLGDGLLWILVFFYFLFFKRPII